MRVDVQTVGHPLMGGMDTSPPSVRADSLLGRRAEQGVGTPFMYTIFGGAPMTLRGSIKEIGPVAISILALALFQFALVQVADARPGPVTPRVFPPGSVPYGNTYGEWVAITFGTEFSTVWDPTACSGGRIGQVELLMSNFGGTSTWACEVPPGTAFLVNVVSAFFLCPTDCGPGLPAPNGTPEEILAAARETINSLPDLGYILECEIDGGPVEDVWSYRAQSPVFYGEIVEGCVFNAFFPDFYPPGPYGPAAADGFWVMVAPLPPGEHVIHFRAVIGTFLPEPLFETDVTHLITVVPGAPGKDADALAVEPATWGAIKATYH